MRDAFGGIVNIAIIVVFLVLVSGYLAFNVNYTKAFRVKNKIISTLEQYEGVCPEESACDRIITNYMKEIGYNAEGFRLSGYDCRMEKGYCIRRVEASTDTGGIDGSNKFYYEVVTKINIEIPIINRIGLRFFQVSGSTKLIDPNN